MYASKHATCPHSLTAVQIVYNEFPIPRPYTNINRPPSPTQARAEPTDTTQGTTQTPSTPVRSLPPVPLFPNSSATNTSHIPDSQPASQAVSSSNPDDLPPALLQLCNGIIATLRASFIDRPPHTIQRLAELIISPSKHYKTLPAWLRAVDRVVNVSSSADIFPLSEQTLVNGVNGEVPQDSRPLFMGTSDTDTRNGYDSASLGSDESLGGALLTPIPWLRNGDLGHNEGESEDSTEEMTQSSGADAVDDGLGEPITLPQTTSSDGTATVAVAPTSDPFVPERPEGAVTQGELIRMEQEAGVVPISTGNAPPPMAVGSPDSMDAEDMGSENAPHARGPDLVGAVDMGKVEGKNVEVRIGSPPQDSEASSDVKGVQQQGAKEAEDGDYEMVDKESDAMEVDENTGEIRVDIIAGDKDEDMVLVDAEGRMDDESAATSVSASTAAPAGDTQR